MKQDSEAVRPRRRWLGWLFGAALGIAVLLVLASRDHVPSVAAARVQRQAIAVYVSSNGKVEPVDPVIARAQFATFVEKVEATEGQAVHKGEMILQLNSDDAKAQLAKARADLLSAQQQIQNAEAGGPPAEVAQANADVRAAMIDVDNLQKLQAQLQRLVAEKAATTDELEQNGVKLAQAKTALELAKQKSEAVAKAASLNLQSAALEEQRDRDLIASLENDVRTARVISPLDGTLYSLPVQSGDYVKEGAVLAEMADLHHVRVRAFVDEPDLGWLAVGQPVEITWQGLPGQVWHGRTETTPKEVVAQEMRSVGQVLCSVENDNMDLIPNINVDVRIGVRDVQNALAIPRGAVQQDGARHFVFLVDGDEVHERTIEVGIANTTLYQVLSGLKEGDEVALSGDITLRDGMQVHAEVGQP